MNAMNARVSDDLKLKLGNLAIAIVLSTVPTSITIGAFSLHGINVCNSLSNVPQVSEVKELNLVCEKAALETSYSYIIWIGLFITLPTWAWFYISMRKSKVN